MPNLSSVVNRHNLLVILFAIWNLYSLSEFEN